MKTAIVTLLFILFHSFAFATQDKKQIKLRITAPGGYLDETNLYFDFGIAPVYSPNEDAPKAYSNIPNAPSVYSLSSDNVFCSTNGYSDLNSSEIISIGIKTDTAGVHVFTPTLLNNFDSTTIIQLEDRLLNVFTDLRVNFYAVQLADSEIINGRFFLHVSRPVQFTSVTAGCANNDGVLQLILGNSIVWNAVNLYDSAQHLIGSVENITGASAFGNLPEGDYNLLMTFGNYVTAKQLHVNGNYIVAHIQPSSLTALVNQEIVFYTNVHNATDFTWSLGDITETQIEGIANPSYAYLQPGIYNVVLTCTNNAGCEYRDSVTVTISSATGITNIAEGSRNITANAKIVTVILNEEIKKGAELKIYNLLGQPVYNNVVTDLTTEITLNEEPNGYYIVLLKNNNVVFTKRVFLGK